VEVEREHARVEEAERRTQTLRELEEGESRPRVVGVDGAEDGVDLRVVAGVSEAEHERAEERHRHARIASRQEVRVVRFSERCCIRDVEKYEEEADDVREEPKKHDGVPSKLDGFRAKDAEYQSSCDLATPDAYARQAHQHLRVFKAQGEAKTRAVHAAEERELEPGIDARDADQQHLTGLKEPGALQ